MAIVKNIFKIILVIQLLGCTLANYGHPDAEFIDFGSPSQQSRDQMIIEAAIKRGMDGDAVAELLRTRIPVTRTTTTPTGFTKTTTYKLEPDGSISSKSILEKRNRYVYNSGSIPDDLKNAPTGTVTKTFTDSDGNKVTRTFSVNRDDTVNADDFSNEFFRKSFSSWPEETHPSPQYRTNHRTVSRTYTSPNGERRTVQSWSSEPEFSQPEIPFTLTNNTPNFRRTSTRTFTGPNGEKHVIQTTNTNPNNFDLDREFPTIPDHNWSGFGEPPFSPSWDGINTDDDDNDAGWELVKDPEVTTKKTVKSWTPKTWEWPEFPTRPTPTTSTAQIEPEPTTTHKPLPSLDDFLKSQYGQPANREPTTSTIKIFSSYTPTSETTTTPKTLTSTAKFIKVDDLPVVEVLYNGKPAGENILRNLPAHLTPHTPIEKVLKIEHKHPIEEDIVGSYKPKVEQNTRSFSTTHIGPEKPRLKDLDPQMQNILKNAGIVPEIEGDTVTKTRTEPDGRVITTTYKVTTVPSTPQGEFTTATQQHYLPPQFHTYQPAAPLQPLQPHLNSIDDFLARLGLTKFDITSRNGRYAKTLVDENGDVLTATFVLTKKATGRK